MAVRRIYLDYNATSPLRPEVRAFLAECLKDELFGNASSVHWSGQRARQRLEDARLRIARLCARKPSEIVFCSGGTEADNLALRGMMFGRGAEHRRLVISSVEHPAVLEPARRLQSEGFELELVSVHHDGSLDLEGLERALAKPTTLVSVMAVNNETGVVNPLGEVIRLAHARGAKVHVDAVQAAGRIPLPVEADLFTLSGHKLGAPPGVGVLVSRESLGLRPEILGGPQERGHRGGTESFVLAQAFAIALERAEADRVPEGARLAALQTRLELALLALAGTSIVGRSSPRVPNTTTALFSGVKGDGLLAALDLAGVMASSGSACSSGSLEASHVLLAMGFAATEAKAAVRFSTGFLTTEEEIDLALTSVASILTGPGA